MKICICMILAVCLLAGCSAAGLDPAGALAQATAQTEPSIEDPQATEPSTAEPPATEPMAWVLSGPIPAVGETLNVGWTESDSLKENALNPLQGLPVYRMDDVQDLEAFRQQFGGLIQLDRKWEMERSFDQVEAEFTEAFFAENALLLLYVTAGSGSFHYGLNRVYREGEKLYLEAKQLNSPQVGTCDMAGWLVTARVKKADLAGITEYEGTLVGGSRWSEEPVWQGKQKGVYEFSPRDTDALYANALNAASRELMERLELLPLYRIDSVEALTAFCDTYMNGAPEDFPVWEADFFAEKSLIVAYVPSPVTAYLYDPGVLEIFGCGELMANVLYRQADPEQYLEFMVSHWLVVYEAEKSWLEDVILYRAEPTSGVFCG